MDRTGVKGGFQIDYSPKYSLHNSSLHIEQALYEPGEANAAFCVKHETRGGFALVSRFAQNVTFASLGS